MFVCVYYGWRENNCLNLPSGGSEGGAVYWVELSRLFVWSEIAIFQCGFSYCLVMQPEAMFDSNMANVYEILCWFFLCVFLHCTIRELAR